MGLVNCFDCGTPISVNADRCPKCGTMDTPMARRSAEEALDVKIQVQEMMDATDRDGWKQILYLFLATIGGLLLMVLIVVANGDW